MSKTKISHLLPFTVLIALLWISGCEEIDGPDSPKNVDVPAELAKITGTWVRVESNNSLYNFMKVEAVAATGTVTYNPNSGNNFSVGSVKWKDIEPQGNEVFNYGELGSDGNYYPDQ
jgi:hypothetical protein